MHCYDQRPPSADQPRARATSTANQTFQTSTRSKDTHFDDGHLGQLENERGRQAAREAGSVWLSTPGSPSELEAERAAQRAMRGERVGTITSVSSVQGKPPVQLMAQNVGTSASTLGAGAQPASPHAAHLIDAALATPGRQLDRSLRDRFEPSFGVSFADVRIHDSAAADRAARAINARAFTRGNDIGFATDHYGPNNPATHRIIAHELAHITQRSPDVVHRDSPLSPTAQEPADPGTNFNLPVVRAPTKVEWHWQFGVKEDDVLTSFRNSDSTKGWTQDQLITIADSTRVIAVKGFIGAKVYSDDNVTGWFNTEQFVKLIVQDDGTLKEITNDKGKPVGSVQGGTPVSSSDVSLFPRGADISQRVALDGSRTIVSTEGASVGNSQGASEKSSTSDTKSGTLTGSGTVTGTLSTPSDGGSTISGAISRLMSFAGTWGKTRTEETGKDNKKDRVRNASVSTSSPSFMNIDASLRILLRIPDPENSKLSLLGWGRGKAEPPPNSGVQEQIAKFLDNTTVNGKPLADALESGEVELHVDGLSSRSGRNENQKELSTRRAGFVERVLTAELKKGGHKKFVIRARGRGNARAPQTASESQHLEWQGVKVTIIRTNKK